MRDNLEHNTSLQRLLEMMEDQSKRMDECLKIQKEMKVAIDLGGLYMLFSCFL